MLTVNARNKELRAKGKKWCPGCKRPKLLSEFYVKPAAHDGYSSRCRECERRIARAKRVRVPRIKLSDEERAARVKARLKSKGEKLAAYKLARGCADCGYDAHPEALEFDHVGDDKFCNVAALRASSWVRILAEIAKCEVVCANCHRIRTANRRVAKTTS